MHPDDIEVDDPRALILAPVERLSQLDRLPDGVAVAEKTRCGGRADDRDLRVHVQVARAEEVALLEGPVTDGLVVLGDASDLQVQDLPRGGHLPAPGLLPGGDGY